MRVWGVEIFVLGFLSQYGPLHYLPVWGTVIGQSCMEFMVNKEPCQSVRYWTCRLLFST